ncbi:ATP-binding protein [Actinoplanes sp. NPDC023801]|uniref:sensor histidine kinase n=1 Tax=Actinoplanes sp. NPDC023801 TaxID=3154595 RepID=UPI0033F20F51
MVERASIRLRTTALAVLVMAVTLAVAAVTLVLLTRASMSGGIEDMAEERATTLAAQVAASGLPGATSPPSSPPNAVPSATGPSAFGPSTTGPSTTGPSTTGPSTAGPTAVGPAAAGPSTSGPATAGPAAPGPAAAGTSAAGPSTAFPAASGMSGLSSAGDDDDMRWRILDADGAVVLTSPSDDDDDRSSGEGSPSLEVTEDSGAYTVVVEASLEEVDDATRALVTPLFIGVAGVLILVGGVIWVVVTGALAPVERIRREVEEITGERLDRRVPIPVARDEIHRLASTMNRMLARLQDSRDRQQRFVADASHELRSPLAGIRQAAEVSRAHPGALPEGELAEAVLEEAGRMERLVEQLLLLTRTGGAGARQLQDVDVDDLVLAEARRVRRAGLTVDASGVGAGRVRGDATALAQVVRNLVDNAARHARGAVAVTVGSTGDRVMLVVEDDGAGIPESERERVFERFVRLDEARDRDAGGSGLGLAIVREIVTAHGGSVSVSTSSLGGARFDVRLPAS